MTIAVQVGGKTRGTIQLPVGSGQDEAMSGGDGRAEHREVRHRDAEEGRSSCRGGC